MAFLNLLAGVAAGGVLLAGSTSSEAYAEAPLGDSAFVLGTGGSGVKVRSGPGLSFDTLGVVSEGARVSVLNGPQSDGDQNWYQIQTTDGAGSRLRGWAASMYLVATGSVTFRDDGSLGTRSFTARVLSYTSGGGIGYTTATGTRVHWGTVAVDPRFIRLGSLLTIDGLDGVFSAEDTGGAVSGAVLDVWFPDPASAQRWGTQQRSVTVLREGY